MKNSEKCAPFYRFCYNLVGLELFMHRISESRERENVPAGGCPDRFPTTSASWDPTTVGWAIAREIYYLGRKSLFKPPFWNWFLPVCNVLPIDRDGHDIAGLRRIIRMLKEGHSVLLFPEGTRSVDGTIPARRAGRGTRRAQGRPCRSCRCAFSALMKAFPGT